MNRNYGQVAESPRIDNAIYDCFEFLNENNQKIFVKKFKEQPHSNIQIMHTFSELLLGAYLAKCGFIVENDRRIGRQTPDWSICNKNSDVIAIVEMVYHHIDVETNFDILAQRKAGKLAIGYFPNANDPENNRLYSQIQEKATKYKHLVTESNLPYVVAVFIDFLAVIDFQDFSDLLLEGENSIFRLYPDLSGVVYFEEANRGSYKFSFIKNPYALREINIPSGTLIKSV